MFTYKLKKLDCEKIIDSFENGIPPENRNLP